LIGTVLSAVAALALVGLGAGALVAPERSAQTYGIASLERDVLAYVRGLGVRDLVLGALAALLLIAGKRNALAALFALAALAGLADFLIVWRARGAASRDSLRTHALGTFGLLVLAAILRFHF